MTIEIVFPVKHESIFGRTWGLFLSFEIGVLHCSLSNSREHLGKVFVFVEHNDRGFCVTPGYIAKQLIDRLRKGLRSVPELAFCDKSMAAVTPRPPLE